MPTQMTQDRPTPALRKLTLTKATLRRLTGTDLRLAVGGASGSSNSCPPPDIEMRRGAQ